MEIKDLLKDFKCFSYTADDVMNYTADDVMNEEKTDVRDDMFEAGCLALKKYTNEFGFIKATIIDNSNKVPNFKVKLANNMIDFWELSDDIYVIEDISNKEEVTEEE